DHRLERGLGAVEDGVEVGVHHLVPLPRAHLADAPVAVDPGVVDQDVHRPELLRGLLEQLVTILGPRDVGLEHAAAAATALELRSELVRLFPAAAIVHGHARALGRDRARDCLSDSAGVARNYCDFAGEALL